MLIFLVAGCAATPRRTGLNQPMPSPEDATLLQEESRSNSQLNEIKSGQEKTNTLLERLVLAMENKTTAPIQAQAGAVKTATAADFNRKPKNIETKGPTAKKSTVVKKQPTAASCNEINKLKERISRVEDVVGYAHPNIETDSVNTFKSGDSYLSERAKTYLDKIVERVNKKEAAIKQIIGYADLSPAGKGATNDATALHRAEAVAQYLKEKGIDLSGAVVRGNGATDRYGNKKENRRATVILEKLPAAQ
ncbi:MAG: OmpA family protein [Candidatus Falkowbacteria bacterium]